MLGLFIVEQIQHLVQSKFRIWRVLQSVTFLALWGYAPAHNAQLAWAARVKPKWRAILTKVWQISCTKLGLTSCLRPFSCRKEEEEEAAEKAFSDIGSLN